MLLHVGGIPEDVDEKVLHAAFIPFGDIMDIQIPLDYETGLQSWQNFSRHKLYLDVILLHLKFLLYRWQFVI